jgi:hypothetical protein
LDRPEFKDVAVVEFCAAFGEAMEEPPLEEAVEESLPEDAVEEPLVEDAVEEPRLEDAVEDSVPVCFVVVGEEVVSVVGTGEAEEERAVEADEVPDGTALLDAAIVNWFE